jgi:hypothetical protein
MRFDSQVDADGNKPLNEKEYNQRLLDSLFSEGMSQDPWSFVNDYILRMLKISEESVSARDKTVARPLLGRDVLRSVIGKYFGALGWDYFLEVPADDKQDSHKFDVLAEKDFRTIVVEVKPAINTNNIDQVLVHLVQAKGMFSRVRVFLGTDISNARNLLCGDDITEVLMEYAMRHQLGVIFADQEQFWIVPAEFLLINTDY